MSRSAKTAGRAPCRRRRWRLSPRGFDLLEGAVAWRFVWSPAQETSAVAEPSAADVIVTNFDHQFGTQGLPLSGAFGAPPAGPSRCVAGKSRRHDQAFELAGQRLAVEIVKCSSEPDMIELAFIVVEP